MAYPKGVVSDEIAARLLAAVKALDEARGERDKAIVAALVSGGSLKTVADLTGMSMSRIKQIGNAAGWPTREYLERLKAANDPPSRMKEVLRWIEAGGELPPPPDPK